MRCSVLVGSISSQWSASFSLALPSRSVTHRNMEMTRELINFTFNPRDMLLSLQYWLQLCQSCSGLFNSWENVRFMPSSETIAPRYLKHVTVPSFSLLTMISLWMPLALLVISLVFSALFAILYLVQVLSRLLTRAFSSCSSSARASMSSADW